MKLPTLATVQRLNCLTLQEQHVKQSAEIQCYITHCDEAKRCFCGFRNQKQNIFSIVGKSPNHLTSVDSRLDVMPNGHTDMAHNEQHVAPWVLYKDVVKDLV